MTSTGKISLKLKSKTAQENEELKKRIEQLEMENADLKSRLADETTSREWLENRVSELTSKNQNLEKRIVELLSEQQSKTCKEAQRERNLQIRMQKYNQEMAEWRQRLAHHVELLSGEKMETLRARVRKSDDESERPPECKVQ